MSDVPRANLTALIAALIEALAAHEAAQRPTYSPSSQELPATRSDDGLPPLMSVPEAAKRLGISRASAYRWAQSGELPARRFGGRVYIVTAQLRDLLAEREADGGKRAA